MTHTLTQHAQTRIRQRGFREQDMELIVECGTLVRPGLHVLRDRDVAKEIRAAKQRIQTLERLRGSAAVVEQGVVVTRYHLAGQAGKRATRPRRHPRQ